MFALNTELKCKLTKRKAAHRHLCNLFGLNVDDNDTEWTYSSTLGKCVHSFCLLKIAGISVSHDREEAHKMNSTTWKKYDSGKCILFICIGLNTNDVNHLFRFFLRAPTPLFPLICANCVSSQRNSHPNKCCRKFRVIP